MSLVRTLVACVIALSVALLPATLGASRVAAATDAAMSMTMDDCCPSSGEPCDKSVNDCAFMAACVLKSFNFAVQESAGAKLPLVQTSVLTPAISADLSSHSGSPPLHPPRN